MVSQRDAILSKSGIGDYTQTKREENPQRAKSEGWLVNTAAHNQKSIRVLIIGGTRFIGPFVVRQLVETGHQVTVFHRGQTETDLPKSVQHLHGDRAQLLDFKHEFQQLAPQVVVDIAAYTEQEAKIVMQAFTSIAQRVVAISSQDVYRAYERVRRTNPGPPDPIPLTEDSPLRENFYPYRAQAKGQGDWQYHYEKILVERVFMSNPDLPGTVLRLPQVYGPGDYQHRLFAYLKRMDDGRLLIPLEEGRANWRWTRGYVENVAAAIALAVVDGRALGRVYNVGEEMAFPEAEWIDRIGQAAGWQGKVVKVKSDQLPVHLAMNLDWNQHLVIDSSRIRRELGYAEPVPLDEAIARTIVWEREHPPKNIDATQFDDATEDAAIARS